MEVIVGQSVSAERYFGGEKMSRRSSKNGDEDRDREGRRSWCG
jgi:hypothetical protein